MPKDAKTGKDVMYDYKQRINKAVYPSLQGDGPHNGDVHIFEINEETQNKSRESNFPSFNEKKHVYETKARKKRKKKWNDENEKIITTSLSK